MPLPRIGRKLKEARKAKNMTQQDVADLLGLESPGQISAWEHDHALPSLRQLQSLSDAFKVEIVRYFPEDEIQHIENEYLDKVDRLAISVESHSSANGVEWILDTSVYHSANQTWPQRIRNSADKFAAILEGKSAQVRPKDGVRLRGALEARAIRLTKVPLNKHLEAELANKYGLVDSAVIVVDVAMPATNALTAIIGTELVAFAAAYPYADDRAFPYEDFTNIALAHGMTIHRFVANVRPSGYDFDGKDFLPLTAISDATHGHADRMSNVLVSMLASKFPYAKALHMPFLDRSKQQEVFGDTNFRNFPENSRERAVANVVHHLKTTSCSVFLSSIRIDKQGKPITTPADGGLPSNATSLLYKGLRDGGHWDQFGGEIAGTAIDKNGNILYQNDVYCSVPPSIFQQMVSGGNSVWLMGAGIERELTFRTALKAKIVNGIVVTKDLAEALLVSE